MKHFLLLTLLTLFTGLAFSQGGGPKKNKMTREEIEAEKIAFISTELALTPEEAEKFWPVYNLYTAEIKELHKERKEYMREMKDIDKLSDDRAYELTELVFQTHAKESEIRIDYLEKFSEILGKKKAAKVFMAEEKFKRVLLKRLKGDGQKHDGPPK